MQITWAFTQVTVPFPDDGKIHLQEFFGTNDSGGNVQLVPGGIGWVAKNSSSGIEAEAQGAAVHL